MQPTAKGCAGLTEWRQKMNVHAQPIVIRLPAHRDLFYGGGWRGFVWVNTVGAHFLGAPFGGYKQSGMDREESADELLEYTQIKNVNVAL